MKSVITKLANLPEFRPGDLVEFTQDDTRYVGIVMTYNTMQMSGDVAVVCSDASYGIGMGGQGVRKFSQAMNPTHYTGAIKLIGGVTCGNVGDLVTKDQRTVHLITRVDDFRGDVTFNMVCVYDESGDSTNALGSVTFAEDTHKYAPFPHTIELSN